MVGLLLGGDVVAGRGTGALEVGGGVGTGAVLPRPIHPLGSMSPVSLREEGSLKTFQ